MNSSSSSSSSPSPPNSPPPSTLDSLTQDAVDAASSVTSSLQSAADSISDVTSSLLSNQSSPSSDFLFSDLYAVTVRLNSAKALAHHADAFVSVSIGNEKRQSKIIKNTADPEWNETFSFVCREMPNEVKMTVWDHKLLTKNQSLGDVIINLHPLISSAPPPSSPSPSPPPAVDSSLSTSSSPSASVNPPSPTPSAAAGWHIAMTEMELPLQHTPSGSFSGTVCVSVMASAISHVVGRSSGELKDVEVGDIDALTALLDLTVVSASHLKRESLLRQDSTFAVVTFGLQSYRTPVVPHSNSPTYDQICPIWLKRDTQSFILKISIYQHEPRFLHHHLIGNAFLRVNELKLGKKYTLNLPLTTEEPHTDKDIQILLSNLKFDVETGGVEGENGASVKVEVTVKKRDDVEKELYAQLMTLYDTNGDQQLEEEELLHLVQTVGAKVSDEQVHKAMLDTTKGNDADHLHVTQDQLPTLFRHPIFHHSDFLRTLHAMALHGPDAMHTLMLKNFVFTSFSSKHASVDASDPIVDNDNTRILVFDRENGIIVRENIPSYIKAAMRVMYRSRAGRAIEHLKRTQGLLKNLTRKQGKKMDSPQSAKMIPVFINTHHLNVDEIEKPVSEYKTFNEFFYRRLKPGVRSCEQEGDDSVLVSPADCRLMVFDNIEQAKEIWVKGRHFSISNVLSVADKDGSLTAKMTGGALVIARLAPQDYHRWHWPVTGKPGIRSPIAGEYNTVNPIAIRKDVDVYTENKRCICPIETEQFGSVILVAVAASMVGSIGFVKCKCAENREGRGCEDGKCVAGEEVKRFDEHGWFAFGGSTVLLIFQPGVVAFDEDLKRNSRESLETLIKVGRRIGVATKRNGGMAGRSISANTSNGGEPKQAESEKREEV